MPVSQFGVTITANSLFGSPLIERLERFHFHLDLHDATSLKFLRDIDIARDSLECLHVN